MNARQYVCTVDVLVAPDADDKTDEIEGLLTRALESSYGVGCAPRVTVRRTTYTQEVHRVEGPSDAT